MNNEIVVYQPNEALKLEVHLENETVWLDQQQMSELFQTTRNNVTLHIRNVFKEKELDEVSVCKESLLTAVDGKPILRRVMKSILSRDFKPMIWTSVNNLLTDGTILMLVSHSMVNIWKYSTCVVRIDREWFVSDGRVSDILL